MKPDFSTHLTEDRRLVVLRVLAESSGYTANEYILKQMLEQFGHVVSSDRVRTDLAWMHEQQLLTVSQVADVHIARITARGQDVAAARTVVPRVKRPHA